MRGSLVIRLRPRMTTSAPPPLPRRRKRYLGFPQNYFRRGTTPHTSVSCPSASPASPRQTENLRILYKGTTARLALTMSHQRNSYQGPRAQSQGRPTDAFPNTKPTPEYTPTQVRPRTPSAVRSLTSAHQTKCHSTCTLPTKPL